jgi:hypothetical protein
MTRRSKARPDADRRNSPYHLITSECIAKVGRFAVIPRRRKGVGVVLSLMRAATREIVSPG